MQFKDKKNSLPSSIRRQVSNQYLIYDRNTFYDLGYLAAHSAQNNCFLFSNMNIVKVLKGLTNSQSFVANLKATIICWQIERGHNCV